MYKNIKTILLLLGIGLIAYGIYTLMVPETVFSVGSIDVKAKDTDNSYIIIVLGLAIVVASAFVDKILRR